MVQVPRSALRARRTKLDDVDLVDADRLLGLRISNEYVPVVSGTAVDVWARPAVVVRIDPCRFRRDRAERGRRPLPPLAWNAEGVTRSVRGGRQAPVEARGPALTQVAWVVNTQHLTRPDSPRLNVQYPARVLVQRGVPGAMNNEVSAGHSTAEHDDWPTARNSSDDRERHLVGPRRL